MFFTQIEEVELWLEKEKTIKKQKKLIQQYQQ
jgi:hypothetical protein